MLMNFENKFDPFDAMNTPIYQTATFKQVTNGDEDVRLVAKFCVVMIILTAIVVNGSEEFKVIKVECCLGT